MGLSAMKEFFEALSYFIHQIAPLSVHFSLLEYRRYESVKTLLQEGNVIFLCRFYILWNLLTWKNGDIVEQNMTFNFERIRKNFFREEDFVKKFYRARNCMEINKLKNKKIEVN